MPDTTDPSERDEGPSEADIARAERIAHEADRAPSAVRTAVWKYFVAAGIVIVILSLMIQFLIFLPGRDSAQDTSPALVPATVTRVIDGSTIAVTLGGSESIVRYAGIRTPEAGQDYAGLAIQANRDWVSGREVMLETGDVDRDAQDRLLRYVYVDGVMVNAALVANGFATVDAADGNRRYQADLSLVEAEAKKQRLGMWASGDSARSDPARAAGQNDPLLDSRFRGNDGGLTAPTLAWSRRNIA